MSNLMALSEQYIGVRQERLALEKKAKEIQNGREKDLRELILLEMSSSGLKSANIKGVGKVVCRESSHYEITDIEALALTMFKKMIECGQQGRPLSDALLLQARIHRDNLETHVGELENDTELERMLSSYGVKKASKLDLAVTKA